MITAVNLHPEFEEKLSEVENTQIMFRREIRKKEENPIIAKTKQGEKRLVPS